MTCYDSCKGRCTREICKYYHPPPVVMEQLMLKGRNSSAVKPGFAQQIPQMFMPIPEVSTLLASANRSDPSLGLAHKVENGCKRSAEVLGETFYPSLYFKRPHIEFPLISPVSYQPIFDLPTPADRKSSNKIFCSLIWLNKTCAGSLISDSPQRKFRKLHRWEWPGEWLDLLMVGGSVADFGSFKLLDNLPVCQDFNRNMCTRMNCRFVHLLERKFGPHVEMFIISNPQQQKSWRLTNSESRYVETTWQESAVVLNANITTFRFNCRQPSRWRQI